MNDTVALLDEKGGFVYGTILFAPRSSSSSSRRAYSWDDDDRQLHISVDACRPIHCGSHTLAR